MCLSEGNTSFRSTRQLFIHLAKSVKLSLKDEVRDQLLQNCIGPKDVAFPKTDAMFAKTGYQFMTAIILTSCLTSLELPLHQPGVTEIRRRLNVY